MRACTTIATGCFFGGELEPGTFHGGKIESGTFHAPVLALRKLSPDPIPLADIHDKVTRRDADSAEVPTDVRLPKPQPEASTICE